MFENFNQDIDQNKGIVAMLVEMATADSFNSSIEEKYIAFVSQKLGIDRTDLAEIMANPSEYPFQTPSSEQDRMTILYWLLFTMRVDGKIGKEEEAICYKFGLKLGFIPSLTHDLISVMKKYANKEIPAEAMLAQIRKYLN